MKTIRCIDNKIVEKCEKCKKKLPKYSPHHTLCHKCWIQEKNDKGNMCPEIISSI